jgi:hypothetical protein
MLLSRHGSRARRLGTKEVGDLGPAAGAVVGFLSAAGAREGGLLELDAADGVEVVEERGGERGAARPGAEVPKGAARLAQAAKGAHGTEEQRHGVEVDLAEGEARAHNGVFFIFARRFGCFGPGDPIGGCGFCKGLAFVGFIEKGSPKSSQRIMIGF